jgi:anti-anti-sigma factor
MRRESHVVHLEAPLHVPHTRTVDRETRALVRKGKRRIVLDLARVRSIDAGGIGALVRAHRRLVASDGVLRIVNAGRWVREPLELVGVLRLLSDE